MGTTPTDLQGLGQWISDKLFKLPPKDIPAPVDNSPGIGHSIAAVAKDAYNAPISTAFNLVKLGAAITPGAPQDTNDTNTRLPQATADYYRSKGIPVPAQNTEDSLNSGGYIYDHLPEAFQQAYSSQLAKAQSPQKDVTGNMVTNFDQTYVEPLLAAGKAAFTALSPGTNIMDIIRGSKEITDPQGKTTEVPLTGDEVVQRSGSAIQKVGILTGLASIFGIKIPSLDSVLSGSTDANINPILSNTVSAGEKRSVAEAKSRNTAIFQGARDQKPDADLAAGSTPIPLDDRGKATAADIPNKLNSVQQITTSNIARAQETAKPLTATFPTAYTSVDPRWDAMHKGLYEGHPIDQVNKQIVASAITEPDAPLPGGGDSWNQFTGRVMDAANEAVARSKVSPEETHVIVTHSDVLKAIAADGDPAKFYSATSGEPGSMFRLDHGPDGLTLTDAPTQDRPGVYLVRHGETSWDAPAATTNEIANQTVGTPATPSPMRSIDELRSALPFDKQQQYMTSVPQVPWVQQQVSDWIHAPAAMDWLANPDKYPPLINDVVGQYLADPTVPSAVANDLQANGLSPLEARRLIQANFDSGPKYGGQVNQVFSNAMQQLMDEAQHTARVGTFDQALDAQKTIDLLMKAKDRVDNSGITKRMTFMNVLGRVENISRKMMIGTIGTVDTIGMSHGLNSLVEFGDAVAGGTLDALHHAGQYANEWMDTGTRPSTPLLSSIKDDYSDVTQYLNAFISRFPWEPIVKPFIPDDPNSTRVHYDPSVYGITPDTYNAIRKDYADGMNIYNRPPSIVQGPVEQDLFTKYADQKLSTDQLDAIVNGQTHRHVVDDLLNANPNRASHILKGFTYDVDSHLMAPQANLLSKALQATFDAYKGNAQIGGLIDGIQAGFESGKTDLAAVLKALPFEAIEGKNGFKENLKTIGKNALSAGDLVGNLLNVPNHLVQNQLTRFQYEKNFMQNISKLGMTRDEALAEMNKTAVEQDPKTGLWQPVPMDAGLRRAAADAELQSMRSTLQYDPKDGLLRNMLTVIRTFSSKLFPETAAGIVFPRYAANFMAYTAAHSPTELLQLFNQDFRNQINDGFTVGAIPKDVFNNVKASLENGTSSAFLQNYHNLSPEEIDAIQRTPNWGVAVLKGHEATRQLSRGMTGLGLVSAAYAMSQGFHIGGYTMGPKPYLLDNGSKNADGTPKYLNISFVGPLVHFLHLGWLTEHLVNQKPLNLDLDEWTNFLLGFKASDTGLFGAAELRQAMSSDNPESGIQKALSIPGSWASRWTRFYKGLQDDAVAAGVYHPDPNTTHIGDKVNIQGQLGAGPTMQNLNPAHIPIKVNPFSGYLEQEMHPGQALLKIEQQPMYPTEKWMTDLGIPTNQISKNVGDATAQARMNQLTGLILQHPQISRNVVKEAVHIDEPIENLIAQLNSRFPLSGVNSETNLHLQQLVYRQFQKALNNQVKPIFMAHELKLVQSGAPSIPIADEFIHSKDMADPDIAAQLGAALKARGIR